MATRQKHGYVQRASGSFEHPPRSAPRPTMGEITVGFVSAELASQRCSDLRQAVEGPLGRPLGNACFSADRTPGVPLGAQGRNSGGVHGDSRPSELLTFGPRIPDAGTNPLGDQTAFEFRDSTKYRKDHLACGRAGVHLLR